MITKFKKSSILAILAILSTATVGLAVEIDALSAADVKIVKREMNAGMEHLAVAQIGVKQAENPDVKKLANALVTDHTAVNAELQAFATQKGVDFASVIGEDATKEIEKLETYRGADFDAKFLANVIKSHKACITAFEENEKGAKNADLKTWGDKVLVALKAHLVTAENLTAK